MSADTLTADNAPVVIADRPAFQSGGSSYAYVATGFAVEGSTPDRVAIAYNDDHGETGQSVEVVEYSLQGGQIYAYSLTLGTSGQAWGTSDLELATIPGAGVAVAFLGDLYSYQGEANRQAEVTGIYAGNGAPFHALTNLETDGIPKVFGTPSGYHVEWTSASYSGFGPQETIASYQQDFQGSQPTDSAATNPGVASTPPYANITIGGMDFLIQDNQAQLAGQAAVTVPGEPAGAMTEVTAAALADGHSAAVAWADSGTDYVSIFDASTDSFGPRIGLDWGGASDLHVVALPDGGFAVSWENNGAYKGALFDSAGDSGGILSLTGQFAAIDSAGDLYTVGINSSSQVTIQDYVINGSGGSSGGGTSGGSGGGGSTTGQTFTSDNNGDTWVGTSGNDTFHLGRGGDTVTGNGGDDTYLFAEIPWAGGHITDFNAGDVLNLTGLMSTTSDTGTDGFADGYLKITDDGQGDAQVWARYGNVDNASDGSGNWWLVETLNGVAASALQHTGDVITEGSASGPTSVSTSDANYVAPSYVTSITLTGSQQHIDASATDGVTINSNNTGNTLIGGAGADTFHLGRGGDVVTGGAGADTFAYAETPWAGGTITDFTASQGDAVDVSGLLAKSGYTGSDPFADGYLKYGTDSSGNAQIWSDLDHVQPGLGWWLVTTLDGLSTSSLHYAGGLIT